MRQTKQYNPTCVAECDPDPPLFRPAPDWEVTEAGKVQRLEARVRELESVLGEVRKAGEYCAHGENSFILLPYPVWKKATEATQ